MQWSEKPAVMRFLEPGVLQLGPTEGVKFRLAVPEERIEQGLRWKFPVFGKGKQPCLEGSGEHKRGSGIRQAWKSCPILLYSFILFLLRNAVILSNKHFINILSPS